MGKSIYMVTVALLLFTSALTLPVRVSAEFYRYITDDGRIHYVDDLTRVPEQYRKQMKIYREKYDHLPESDRLIMLQKERDLDEQRTLEENRISEEQKREQNQKLLETDVIIKGNQVLVPVKINHGIQEKEGLFLLDTGAERTVIFREFANHFEIIPEEKGLSQVAGGGLVPTDLVIVDSITVGPMQISNSSATVIDNLNTNGIAFDFNGLLGMNILRNIEYTIDFDNQKIRWILPSE
jgi:hypothetical protein